MRWKYIVLALVLPVVLFYLFLSAVDKKIYSNNIEGFHFEVRVSGTYKWYKVKVLMQNMKNGKIAAFEEKEFDLVSDASVEEIVNKGDGKFIIKHVNGRELLIAIPK